MLFLRTFGGLAIENGGRPVVGAASQRGRLAILAVLAASGDRAVSRDRLHALFWPDSDSERARAALNQALYALRRDVGERALTVGTTELGLNPAVIQSDVAEFERALGNGDIERAAELYTGPFLDAIHLSGLEEFEEWVERERGRLVAVYQGALERAARDAQSSNDVLGRVRWWKVLAALDPMSARNALGVMEALVAAGDRESAIRDGEAYAQLVRARLGVENADPAIAGLIERLRRIPARDDASQAPPPSPYPVSVPAVETVTVAHGPAPVGRPRLRWVGVGLGTVVVALAVLLPRAVRARELAGDRLAELRFAARPPSFDARTRYGQAADALTSDQDGTAAAVAKLREALAADTGFGYAALLLMEIEESAADSIGQRFDARRRLLSTHEQTLLDARVAAGRGDLGVYYVLAERARTAEGADPVAIRYFADAAMRTNRYAAAKAAYDELRATASWIAPLFSTWLSAVDAHHMAGDFTGAVEEWQRGNREWPDNVAVCQAGVVQMAALGRLAAIDSIVEHCVPRDVGSDLNRLGRRIRIEDELYRRAGRELLWHGHADAGRRVLARARELEAQLHAADTAANNGWLAAELMGDWPAAYRLMREDLGAAHPCRDVDRRPVCAPRWRIRYAVTTAHVGDTATALATIAWLDAGSHPDSAYKVERAKILLALGRVDEAMRSIHEASWWISAAVWLHANTELLPLRGNKVFEAIIAPRVGNGGK